MPCGWLNTPAPKRTTRFPNGSNLAIGSTVEPTQSTAPHLSNTHRLLPSRSSATLVARPILRPSGKFNQSPSTQYEEKAAFCCAEPWPASNASTAAQPSAPQRPGIETLRDIALLRFRTALSRFLPRRVGGVAPMPSPQEVRLRKPPRPYRIIPGGLDFLRSAHVLVEPLNGARPCLLGRYLVVAFRRRIIEETMNRIRINVAFEPDVVFLQLSLLRRIGLRQPLVEGAVVDEDGRLDFRHIFRIGRTTVERGGRRQVRAQQNGQVIGHTAAKAKAGCANFSRAVRTRFQPLRGSDEILGPLGGIDLGK